MKRVIKLFVFCTLFFSSLTIIAQNSCGTVKDYDGNTYKTVQIGRQCWMAENLRTIHYANGDAIGAGDIATYSSSSPYCYKFKNLKGLLYNWPAVMNYQASSLKNPSGVQGVCPDGWHVPSYTEWQSLIMYIGDQSPYFCEREYWTAKSLASKTGWEKSDKLCAVGNNQSKNNATGFNAYPTGYCYFTGLSVSWEDEKYGAYFWTSTKSNEKEDFAYTFWLSHKRPDEKFYGYYKSAGLSVRCVRD